MIHPDLGPAANCRATFDPDTIVHGRDNRVDGATFPHHTETMPTHPTASGTVDRRLASRLAPLLLAVATASCQPSTTPDPSPAEFRAAVTGTEWTLRELDGSPAAVGAGGRAPTLQFEADTARVAGFAGCNRWFGSYTLDGRALRFGGIGMTRMACTEGMELEQRFAAALAATRRYELSGAQLTLLGEAGPVARFDRRAP